MGKRRPLAQVDGNRIRRNIPSSSSLQSSSTNTSSLVDDEDFNFLSGPIHKKTRATSSDNAGKHTRSDSKTPKISNCRTGADLPDLHKRRQHDQFASIQRGEQTDMHQRATDATLGLMSSMTVPGLESSIQPPESPRKRSSRPEAKGTSLQNTIRVLHSQSTVPKSDPNSKQNVVTRKKVSKFQKGPLETIFEDERQYPSIESPTSPSIEAPKHTAAEIRRIVLGSTRTSSPPYSNSDDNKPPARRHHEQTSAASERAFGHDVVNSSSLENGIGTSNNNNPDDDMDLAHDDKSLSSTSTEGQPEPSFGQDQSSSSVEHTQGDQKSVFVKRPQLDSGVHSVALEPIHSAVGRDHSPVTTRANDGTTTGNNDRPTGSNNHSTKQSKNRSLEVPYPKIAASVDAKSNNEATKTQILPWPLGGADASQMPPPRVKVPPTHVQLKSFFEVSAKRPPDSDSKPFKPLSTGASVQPFSTEMLENCIHSPPDNQAVLKAMLASHSGEISNASPFSNIVIKLDSSDECSLDKSELTMEDDVSPHQCEPSVESSLHARKVEDTRRVQSEPDPRMADPEPALSSVVASHGHLLHSGLIPTPTDSEHGTSPAMWTAEDAGSVGGAPVFRLPDGRRFRHPPLPPGWTLGVDRSQNRPYYHHPDFGCSFHAPVPLPTRQNPTVSLIRALPTERPSSINGHASMGLELATPAVNRPDANTDGALQTNQRLQSDLISDVGVFATQYDYAHELIRITTDEMYEPPTKSERESSDASNPDYKYETPRNVDIMSPTVPLSHGKYSDSEATHRTDTVAAPGEPSSFHSVDAAAADAVEVAVCSHRQRPETAPLETKDSLAKVAGKPLRPQSQAECSGQHKASDTYVVDGPYTKRSNSKDSFLGSPYSITPADRAQKQQDTSETEGSNGLHGDKSNSNCTSRSSSGNQVNGLQQKGDNFETPILDLTEIEDQQSTTTTEPTTKTHDSPAPLMCKGVSQPQAADPVDFGDQGNYESPDDSERGFSPVSNNVRQPSSDPGSPYPGTLVDQSDGELDGKVHTVESTVKVEDRQWTTVTTKSHDKRDQVVNELISQRGTGDASDVVDHGNCGSPHDSERDSSPAFSTVYQPTSDTDSSSADIVASSTGELASSTVDLYKSPQSRQMDVRLRADQASSRLLLKTPFHDEAECTDLRAPPRDVDNRDSALRSRSSLETSDSYVSICRSRMSYRALHPPLPLCSLQNLEKLGVPKANTGQGKSRESDLTQAQI